VNDMSFLIVAGCILGILLVIVIIWSAAMYLLGWWYLKKTLLPKNKED